MQIHTRQQGDDDLHRHDQVRCGEEHHQNTDIAQGHAQIHARLIKVIIGDRARDLREDRGADGNRDQRIREDIQCEGVLIRAVARNAVHVVACERGAVGDAGVDDIGHFLHAHDAKTPCGHRAHGTQADASDTPLRLVLEPQFDQRNKQHQRLEGHAQSPRAGGKHDLFRGPERHRLMIRTAKQT